MKFKNGGLAGGITCNRQYVADSVIVIPDRVATSGDHPDQAPKFIIAVGDRATNSLSVNCGNDH